MKKKDLTQPLGFTLIELLVSLTLSLLIVTAGLTYYQWSLRILKKQQKEMAQELAVRNVLHWIQADIQQAGWMGCRFWDEALFFETDVPKVAAIEEKMGQQAVWRGLASAETVSRELESTSYRVAPDSPVIWIQTTVPYQVGRPVVLERCDRISILLAPRKSYSYKSFSSVLWFTAEHQDGHCGVYRRDLFGQTEEVLRSECSTDLNFLFKG